MDSGGGSSGGRRRTSRRRAGRSRGRTVLRRSVLARRTLPSRCVRCYRPIAGYGAEGVGDGDDSRLERDHLPAQAPRITFSVKALVVVQNRGCDLLQRGHLPDKLIPDPRVQLNDAAFLGRQAGRLEQDPLQNAQLANVMQEGRKDQTLRVAVARVEPVSDSSTYSDTSSVWPRSSGSLSSIASARTRVVERYALRRLPCSREFCSTAPAWSPTATRASSSSDSNHRHGWRTRSRPRNCLTIDRDRQQVADLLIGSGSLLSIDACSIVFTDGGVAFDHLVGEPLSDRAVLGIVLEPGEADDLALVATVSWSDSKGPSQRRPSSS